MRSRINWPNVVTITRIGLLFALVILAYGSTVWSRLLAAALAIVVIVGDWLDGHLARRLDRSTALGSVLDIAADRIVESVLWIVLADLDLVPVWVPVVFISRGILTDTIRNYTLRYGYSGFGEKTMMQSSLGKFLTGSPIMRTSFAVIKAFSFSWLLAFAVMDQVLLKWPLFPIQWVEVGLRIGYWGAVTAAVMSLARGIPVVVEGIALIRREERKTA